MLSIITLYTVQFVQVESFNNCFLQTGGMTKNPQTLWQRAAPETTLLPTYA